MKWTDSCARLDTTPTLPPLRGVLQLPLAAPTLPHPDGGIDTPPTHPVV